MAERKPLIGIPADRRILGPHPFHCVGEKYIRAVAEAADAVPVLIPSLGDEVDLDAILDSVDGILLTGSPSNVEPQRYAGPASDPGTLHDPHRDATTLPLIPRVIAAGMPLLRGLPRFPGDERRVRRYAVAEGAGSAGHARPPRGQERAAGSRSTSRRTRSSWPRADCCSRLAGADRVMVNSLHAQGVRTLGEGLAVEARAPDGLIEASACARRPDSRSRCSGTPSGRR